MSASHQLFYLIAAHFVLDYPLQGDTTAREKNPTTSTPLQAFVPWYYWMTAHCLMQASAVLWLTGRMDFAIAEFVIHFGTDIGKCKNMFSIHTDQAIHIACKLAWWGLA